LNNLGDNGSLLSLETVKSLSKCEHLKSLSLCLPCYDAFEDFSIITFDTTRGYLHKKIPFQYFVSDILSVISIKSLKKLQLDFSLWTFSQQNYFMAQSVGCFQHLYKVSLKFTSKTMFLNDFNIGKTK
jgi:hypothetical protein